MNCLVTKGSRVTVDKLAGRAKWVTGKGGQEKSIEAETTPKFGTIQWEEWLQQFTPEQRNKILERHKTPKTTKSARVVRLEREAADKKTD